MLRILVLLCWVIFVPVAMAQDPVKTDGDKYKALMENERVRVLEYRDRPGEKTSMHHHPDFVLYALTPFKRKLTLGDGKTIIREFKTGDVLWSPAQAHIGENIGTTETHVIIVELKENAPGSHEGKKAPSRPADK
jgi:quercetin dioxygenase-like cupin family protein